MPRKPDPNEPIPINEQIAVVKRHLMQIENTYPRLVKECELTPEAATKGILRFRAVLATLLEAKHRLDAVARGEAEAASRVPFKAVTVTPAEQLGTYTAPPPYTAGGTE